VLTGRIRSDSLSKKYHILKNSQECPQKAMASGHAAGWLQLWAAKKPAVLQKLSADFAALEHHTAELQRILEQLGLQIICVQFDGAPSSPFWSQSDADSPLDSDLLREHAGVFDSGAMAGGSWFAFFHVPDLGRGLRVIKQALESRKLLNHARIFHIETESNGWRIYWPATAELLLPDKE
jgi:hypothetical protein